MEWPSEAELRDKNRARFAGTYRWPDGALDACRKIDAAYPGFYTNWQWAGGPTYPRDGYYSYWLATGGPPVYGATIQELEDELRFHPRTTVELTPLKPLKSD